MTTPADLVLAEFLLSRDSGLEIGIRNFAPKSHARRKSDNHHATRPSPTSRTESPIPNPGPPPMRIGQGIDIHAFGPRRPRCARRRRDSARARSGRASDGDVVITRCATPCSRARARRHRYPFPAERSALERRQQPPLAAALRDLDDRARLYAGERRPFDRVRAAEDRAGTSRRCGAIWRSTSAATSAMSA